MSPLTTDKTWEAVVYADGGANPNPGFAGYGIHGYLFQSPKDPNFVVPKKLVIHANHFMEFFSKDAMKLDYVAVTSKGYLPYLSHEDAKHKPLSVTPEFYLDRCVSFFEPVTNNVAELTAAVDVFQELLDSGEAKIVKLTLILDSKHVLDTLTQYGDGYRRNGWVKSDGTEPKNLALVKLLMEKRDAIKAKGIEIVYEWVKGHSGNMGNGMADYHATIAVRRARVNDNLGTTVWSPARKYWDNDTDRHPFMYAKRSYFNRVRAHNTPGQYYLIEPASEDLLIGKRDHEGYAVVKLKEPCVFMEAVIDAQGTFGQEENRVILGRMDRVYSKFIQKFVKQHGRHCFNPSENKRSVNFLDLTPVAVEHNPPALIYRVTEAFHCLDERLEEFIRLTGSGNDSEPNVDGIVIHEITEEFYTLEEKKVGKETIQKTVLKPGINVGYKNHVIEMEEDLDGKAFKYKVALALGMDLPSRNCLRQLEEYLPKIYLITWRSAPLTLQYACVVDCLSGIGVWSNYFCDRIFLKSS